MAEEGEPEEPRRARRVRKADAGTRTAADPEPDRDDAGSGDGAGADRSDGSEETGRAVPAAVAARRAAQQVAEFTGRSPECVVSIDGADGGWQVGVEVVETRRIPDTQDVLAIYEVRVDGAGDLVSYQRTRRYARGQLDGRCR